MKQSETILVLSAVLVFAGGVAGSSQASEPISVDAVSESRDWTEDTEPLIDLVIVKDASSPTPLHGIVNYTIAVTNKGPDAATDVQVADPAPGSSLAPAIGYLTANPSQGTCNIAPSLLRCGLDTITAGETVTIAVTGRARDVGEQYEHCHGHGFGRSRDQFG